MIKGKRFCPGFVSRLFMGLMGLLVLSDCGQPGPLYLPSSKPPIYVEPESEPETKDKDKNPGTPPPPENKQPAAIE